MDNDKTFNRDVKLKTPVCKLLPPPPVSFSMLFLTGLLLIAFFQPSVQSIYFFFSLPLFLSRPTSGDRLVCQVCNRAAIVSKSIATGASNLLNKPWNVSAHASFPKVKILLLYFIHVSLYQTDLVRDINIWSEKVRLAFAHLNYKHPTSILQIDTESNLNIYFLLKCMKPLRTLCDSSLWLLLFLDQPTTFLVSLRLQDFPLIFVRNTHAQCVYM